MPSRNQEFSNKGSTSLMHFSTGQSYLFTLHLKYSIIHFNVTIIFTSTSKLCGRFALKWICPRLLRPHFDSADDKQHSTTPLIKMLFAWIILPPLLNRSSVLHDLRNLDDCHVDLEYITAKCYVDHYMLSLSLWRLFLDKSTSCKSKKVIYLGSLMLMPQQQHYTCHILRSLSTNPS